MNFVDSFRSMIQPINRNYQRTDEYSSIVTLEEFTDSKDVADFTEVTKFFKIQNNGNREWPADTKLVFVEGFAFGNE